MNAIQPGQWIRLRQPAGHPLTQWRRLREVRPYAGPSGWDVLLDFADGYTASWDSARMGLFETSTAESRPDGPASA
jgi:hypothetical protein